MSVSACYAGSLNSQTPAPVAVPRALRRGTRGPVHRRRLLLAFGRHDRHRVGRRPTLPAGQRLNDTVTLATPTPAVAAARTGP